MYQTIVIEEKEVRVMSVEQAAKRLACAFRTIYKRLGDGRLQGTQIYDEKTNRMRQFVFVDSVFGFKPSPPGRQKGSKDKGTDRTRKIRACRENGRLGGLAGRGGTKRRSRKRSSLDSN